MKFFSDLAFEKLLFPLNKKIYRGIDKALQQIEMKNPGCLNNLVNLYKKFMKLSTTEMCEVPKDLVNKYGLPAFDIVVNIDEENIKKINKTNKYQTSIVGNSEYEQNLSTHLIVNLNYCSNARSSYIVPFPFILKSLENTIAQKNRYQLYQHTLIKKKNNFNNISFKDYSESGYMYVGITRRTWQERYKEHWYASQKGSHLLFHKALREELFKIECYEHEILRAGLTKEQALRLEEIEIENRTLRMIHQQGLNMIPGGEAGLKYISQMNNKNRNNIDPEYKDYEIDMHIKHNFNEQGLINNNGYKNEKMAKLWRDDINFQIKALTNSNRRLSYNQIMYARICYASGWSLEKILEYILKMEEDRKPNFNQIKNLLEGKTFQRIPHVILD